MKHGYARVSSTDQSLEIQIEALTKAGCERVWSEKKSGASRESRQALESMLGALWPGDEVWITKIDRLARSIRDLANIVEDLKARGISLKALDQNIDTSTPAGVAFVGMLGIFSQFERELIRDRQKAGIAKAKAAGKYLDAGRPAIIDPEAVRRLDADGMGATEISRKLKIGRASVYRLLKAAP